MDVFADSVKWRASTGGRVGRVTQFLDYGDGTTLCSRVSWAVNTRMVMGEEGSRSIASVWQRCYLTLLGGAPSVDLLGLLLL